MQPGPKREWIIVDHGDAAAGPNGGKISRREICTDELPIDFQLKTCDSYIVVEQFEEVTRHTVSFGVPGLIHVVHPCLDLRHVEAHIPVIKSRLDDLVHLVNVKHLYPDD